MRYKICFLMYPWRNINPEVDSTLRLVHECASRGHTVAIASMNNLTIRDSVASAFCDLLVKSDNVSQNIPTFYRKASFHRNLLPLAGFDAIILRNDPPLDNFALNFLDSVREHTFIMNDINGLRIANNKLYTPSFHDPRQNFIPATHVSKNHEYLERVFMENEHDKMILKPLNGFGGHGVIVLEKKAKLNFRSLLDFYIGHNNTPTGNYVILQDYVEGAEEGDIRILMLNGSPIGAMRRVPADGELRSNVHAGGTARKHVLTKEEKALCDFVGPKLVKDGIYFAGLDVISNQLIEVNVLCPGGITRINHFNRCKLQKNVIDFVEENIKKRENQIIRKNELRQLIESLER